MYLTLNNHRAVIRFKLVSDGKINYTQIRLFFCYLLNGSDFMFNSIDIYLLLF